MSKHDEIKALLEEIRDRLPEPEGVKDRPAPADDLPGEPVEPGDLRAGDRVSFTWGWIGERITGTLLSDQGGDVLRSDAPDSGGYHPNVAYLGRKWCAGISDVRLIERAPREDEDPDEALAKVLRSASERLGDWGALHETTRDEYRNMARAAREHIEAEWKPYILREQTAREKAQDRAAKAEAERDALRERLDALRADVDRHARRAGKKVWTRATGRDAAVQDALWDILARDTARAKGER